MTQMLLFDAPAGMTDSALVAVAESPRCPTMELAAPELPAKATGTATESLESPCTPGLHHMGDLARLVLLRYDLMAKRRAQRLAK